MKLSATIAALCATVALAAPAKDINIDKRTTLGVYLCNDREFTGYCVHIPSTPNECVPLAADLNDLVSSAGPDKGSFCYFFVNPNCDATGDFFHVDYPGIRDLSQTPVNGAAGSTRNFEDKLSSFFCITA